jgi:hypothetical protein
VQIEVVFESLRIREEANLNLGSNPPDKPRRSAYFDFARHRTKLYVSALQLISKQPFLSFLKAFGTGM